MLIKNVSLLFRQTSYIAFIYFYFHPQRKSFSKQYLTTLSEFLLSHSCCFNYCSFTFSTGVQPIAKIAEPLDSFHFITYYFLLLFSCTIRRFITFITFKKSCQTWSYFLQFRTPSINLLVAFCI